MADQISEIKPKRYVFLFIIGAFSILFNLALIIINLFLLSGSSFVYWLIKVPIIDTITGEELHGNYIYFLLKIAIHTFCIYTIILILLMKRRGFFYYLGVQLALLAVPFLFLMSLGFSYLLINMGVSAIFSIFFIMLFSLYIPRISKNKNP
jgi:hypothetical protein